MSLSTSLDDLLGPTEPQQQPQMNMINNQPPVNMTQQHMNPHMDNNQFVDAILTELESMPDYGRDQNAANQQYAMNPDAHVPPPHIGDTSNLLKAQNTQIGNVVDLTDKFANGGKSGSFFNRYKSELIATGTFLLLMFIFSLHQVNRLMFGFMPKLILENGQISIYGIIIKTMLATIIFGLVVFLV